MVGIQRDRLAQTDRAGLAQVHLIAVQAQLVVVAQLARIRVLDDWALSVIESDLSHIVFQLRSACQSCFGALTRQIPKMRGFSRASSSSIELR